MPSRNIDLTTKLIETGKVEFLRCGYRNTTMRAIASKLNITTGAIYGHFDNKEIFFCTLVDKTASEFKCHYNKMKRTMLNELGNGMAVLPANMIQGELICVARYVLENIDTFRLLLMCSQGTKYEAFLDTIIEIDASANKEIIDLLVENESIKGPIDKGLILILSSVFVRAMFEITVVCSGSSQKKEQLLSSFVAISLIGWKRILSRE